MDDQKKIQRATLITVIISAFITTFMGSALNLSIPAMGEYFSVSASTIGWIVTVYMLTVSIMSIPFGRIADMTSRKKIYVLGIVFFSISSLAAAFSPNFAIMILLRVCQGISGSMIFATNVAILVSEYPPEKRGRVLGQSVASTYAGLSAGPVVGGILNHWLGWRSIFIATALISVVAAVVAMKNIPERKAAYVKGEPLIPMRLFRGNKSYIFSNLAALLNYAATFAMSYYLSIYLQVVKGFNSQWAGIILIALPLVQALLSPWFGRLSDRISPFKLATTGMGLTMICLVIAAFIDEDFSLWLLIPMLMLAGFGFAMFSSPNTNAVMSCVDEQDFSMASSILATMRSFGHTASMGMVTVITGIFMGNTALADAEPTVLIHTMHVSFLVFVGISLLGIFCSFQRREKKA